MKHFMAAYHTDAGIKKGVNQDSLLLKLLTKESEEILLAVLCDGVGGMEKGELASATVVRAFSKWFDNAYLKGGWTWKMEEIQKQWQAIFEEVNGELLSYGKRRGQTLGTTATALLISSSGAYLIGHVGDTRVYRMNAKIAQMTEDHVYTGNVLLQCIGVNNFLEPQFLRGFFHKGESVLLCSDGFRHKVTEQELLENLHKPQIKDVQGIKWKLVKLVELNKKRHETDNITAIHIRIV